MRTHPSPRKKEDPVKSQHNLVSQDVEKLVVCANCGVTFHDRAEERLDRTVPLEEEFEQLCPDCRSAIGEDG